MNNLDKQYLDLAKDILENGVKKATRNGDVLSVFGRTIRHKMSEGFPLLTTKKMYFKGIVTELLWFLKGGTNIKYILDNNCHIWDGDCYKNYEQEWLKENPPMSGPYTEKMLSKEEFINSIKTDDKFAEQWGELGPIYGSQWRKWEGFHEAFGESNRFIKNTNDIDQIENLINELKINPDSRRMIVSAWNPAELSKMVLPPCHYGFQVYTRELSLEERENYFRNEMGMKNINFLVWSLEGEEGLHKEYDKQGVPRRAISLMWSQRSVDLPLGLPFNIASYGLLLEMLADEVNMMPDELIGSLGDCHIYQNQIDGVKEQLTREPLSLPTIHIRDGIYCSSVNDVILDKYISHPGIHFPLSN